MTAIRPASDPAYLRELAATYARSSTPAHRAAGERLLAIAADLEKLLANRLATGTDAALARIRAAQAAPAPTPEQLAELRNLRKQGKL